MTLEEMIDAVKSSDTYSVWNLKALSLNEKEAIITALKAAQKMRRAVHDKTGVDANDWLFASGAWDRAVEK